MVLQSIRERLTGILAFAILGILIIPFALVGVTQYFTAADSNIVARVNEIDITTNDFNQSFSNYRRRMESILGARYDPVQFDQLTVRRQHLDSLIDQELLTQAAASLGLDVDDETLAEEIRSIPAFQVDGQFNADVYQSRLQSQGMSPTQFQRQMRAQFVVGQLPANITASSFATPSELKEFVALVDQTRTFNAVMVPALVAETPSVFDEATISAWYESHADDYQSEERVVIEYIELDVAFLPAGIPPEEDFLRDQFESQKGRFISPEQRHVAHILISADGGDLGWVEVGVMVKAFENAMYELTMASPVSGPVQTGFGWHVIKLLEIRESSGMSFEEARMQLVIEYEEDAAQRAFLEQADRLVDLIYEDPTTLESAAMVMDLPVNTAGPFSRSGGEGVAANAEVITASFSDMVLLQGSVSDPVNLDENRLVMIRMSEHLPVVLKPLDEVRDEIITALADNQARDNAEAQATELLAALQSGAGEFEVLATEAGLEYASHEATKRVPTTLAVNLVQEVFRLQVPATESDPIQTVLPTVDGFAVVELISVDNGVMDEGALLAQQQLELLLANANASHEAFALMRQLRTNAEVTVFEERIQ